MNDTGLRALWNREKSPLPHLPWAFRQVLRHSPWETATFALGLVVRRLGAPAILFLLQRIIDALSAGATVPDLVQPFALLIGVISVVEVMNSLLGTVEGRSWEKMAYAADQLILTKSASLTLDQFDHAETHDLIEQASRESARRLGRLVMFSLSIVAAAIGAVSVLALLISVSPAVALTAVLVALPISWAGIRQGARLHVLERSQSPARRFTRYLGELLSRREAATELRAYQLVTYFLDRWRASFAQRRADHLDVRWAGVKEGWAASLLAAVFYVVAMVQVIWLASRGQIGAGQIVVLIGSVRILQEAMTHMATDVGFIWQESLPIMQFRRFLDLPSVEAPAEVGRPFPEPLRGPIRMEDVTFSYPGASAPVLRGVTLEIQPGEKVALVGENGAGKSTLIKLLLGLYKPSGGRITFGGVDLADIAPASLRQHMSCVFQDFVRYDMTLRENVQMGRLGASPVDVAEAGRAAGLSHLVESLPQGYDTMLGKTFAGGIDVSGGQWQRIALARAFVRNAQVIVLDEPTAALDPIAELEVFGKFVELVRGHTAILISHRLGSARLADRIILLDEGRVAEEGSHDQLMAVGGHYAQLFRTQAQWYVDQAETEAV